MSQMINLTKNYQSITDHKYCKNQQTINDRQEYRTINYQAINDHQLSTTANK